MFYAIIKKIRLLEGRIEDIMNRKRIWLVLPMSLIPYAALFALAVIFFASTNSAAKYIMESVFNSNALLLIAGVLIYIVIACILNCVCFFISIAKNWNALSVAKTVMIIKLMQIPAYILIFVLGVLFLITIFTLPFSVALFLLDILTLLMTGLLEVGAVVLAVRQSRVGFKENLWIVIFQFLFCIDVVASVIFYIKLKRKNCK